MIWQDRQVWHHGNVVPRLPRTRTGQAAQHERGLGGGATGSSRRLSALKTVFGGGSQERFKPADKIIAGRFRVLSEEIALSQGGIEFAVIERAEHR